MLILVEGERALREYELSLLGGISLHGTVLLRIFGYDPPR